MKKIKIKNGKKGSHVSVILSFIIFIGFLLFLYPVIIGPILKSNSNNAQILDSLKIKFLDKVSENATLLSVNIDSTSQNCVSLTNLISNAGITSHTAVRDSQDVLQGTYISGNDLEINRKSSGEDFFKIVSMEKLDGIGSSTLNCEGIPEGSYDIGLIKTEKYVFEGDIADTINEYNSDYETLRKSLIDSSNEFGFTFVYENGTKIGSNEDISIDVEATEISIQYVNLQGEILSGNLNLRVW